MNKEQHEPSSSTPMYRNNTPDALFGSILTIEATLGVILGKLAKISSGPTEEALAAIIRDVESALSRGAQTTKYGTGAMEISDGELDSLQAITARAREVAARRV